MELGFSHRNEFGLLGNPRFRHNIFLLQAFRDSVRCRALAELVLLFNCLAAVILKENTLAVLEIGIYAKY